MTRLKNSDKSIKTHSGKEDINDSDFLEGIIDTIRESILILDKNYKVISANNTFYNRFKVKPEETINKSVYKLGNGQWNIPALKKLLEEILPEKNPFNDFRVEHKFPDIGSKVMLLNARQIKEQGHWQDRILLAIEDITKYDHDRVEKEKSQVALKDSEDKFKNLANNIPNLAWIANSKGDINWYNKQWYEYTGTTPQNMKGWGWKKVHDPKVLPEVLKKWKYSIKTGEFFDMVFPLKGADGKFRPFLTRVTPIKDEKGNILQWFGTNTDITRQKELEAQKDDFVSMASHELKTPVTSMKLYTNLVRQYLKTNQLVKAIQMVGKVEEQSEKLKKLVEALLDISKAEAGKLKMEKQVLQIDELVKHTLEDIVGSIPEHKVVIKKNSHLSICGDRYRLYQVVTNLITNAIKYSSSNSEIVIDIFKKNNNAIVSIKDKGIGIDKDQHKMIFDKLYQVSDSKGNTYPGLGMGLYISKEIIERHDGKIWVNSQKGKGSTFYFSLPIYKE